MLLWDCLRSVTAGPSKQRHLTGMTSPHLIQDGCHQEKWTGLVHHNYCTGRATTHTEKHLLYSSFPPSVCLSFIQGRMTKQTEKGNKLPPILKKKHPAQGALVFQHCAVYYLTNNQSLGEQSTCTQNNTHTHIPHTLLESDSLIQCCHGNPIKGDTQAATPVKSACLSAPRSLSFRHTFLFFHCQPFLFVSLHYSLFLAHCTSPGLLASPLAQLSALLSLLLCHLFIFLTLKASSCLYS